MVQEKVFKNLLVPLTGIIILLLAAGCQPDSPDAIRLTEDEQSKEAVFRQILADEELLNEFLNELNQNEEAMEFMMSHGKFMRQVYSVEFTSKLVRQNPDMREVMIQNIIGMMQQDSSTYQDMNERMEEFHESMGEMR